MICLVQAGEFLSDAISEIIARSFAQQAKILGIRKEEYPNFVAFETAAMVRKRIEKGDRVVLAYLQGTPVGTVSYSWASVQPGRGHIKRLCLLPELRGHGYGEYLMEYAETRLAEAGTKVVEISTVARFERLVEYYRRLGYVVRDKKRFPTLPSEVQFMEKTICY